MGIKLKPNLARYSFEKIIFTLPWILIFFFAGIFLPMFLKTDFSDYFYLGYLFLLPLPFIFYSLFLSIGSVKNTQYFVDDKFVSRKSLFLHELRSNIPIKEITNVDYEISWFFDKLFKTGSVRIYTAGSQGADLMLGDIKNVVGVYDKINNFLKLQKSIKLSASGEVYGTHQKIAVESELLQRVKPDVFFATIGVFISIIFSSMIFIFALGAPLLPFLFDFGIDTKYVIGLILFLLLIYFSFFILLPILLSYKSYKRRYYDFYTDKLEYYDGFLTLRKATVPLERITNIDENKSLFGQIFNISTINIETAGSSGAEVSIGYVKNGEKIVSYLKEVLKKHGRN